MPRIEALLVEDSRADVYMLREALTQAELDYHLNVVEDGDAAVEFLHQRDGYQQAPHPDLIILDINLPIRSGRDVLSEIVPDQKLRRIPLVVLTSSATDQDIVETFGLPDNCYMVKPATFQEYVEVAKAIEEFRQSATNQARV